MASEDPPTKQDEPPVDASFDDPPNTEEGDMEIVRVGEDVEAGAASQMGATRYVIAGYFAGMIGFAYILGQTLTSAWTRLAEQQWAVDRAPWITQVGEDGRGTWATLLGGIISIAVTVHLYRRQDIRNWLNDAASELAKVTWPTKKEVTNGTVVVIVATIIATLYVALLDRFWGFVTDLVYRV